ncbi:MAG: SUMF1/EgtB/PvdO family nonheme iron enzyme [Phycisphaerales bacterium]|nr:SUMF1/EgtB/PvdO family nonheme iron enzyme [Phycisphaerales bacterium]
MRPAPYLTFVALMSASAFAQTAPVVSNVHASQRGDGSRLVDIRYDLAHQSACTVWVAISDDGGQNWSVPVRTLSGDVGNGITGGLNRWIVWDAGADIPGVISTVRARVYADDSSPQGNMVFVAAGTFPYQRGLPLYVASFWIDKYEMTNQRYAEFLNDADPNGTYWNASMEITRTGSIPSIFYAVLPGRQNYPIRYVSPLDAEAYAAWLSAREGRTYRLPTEQEWEKAAAWDPTIDRHWVYGFQSDSITCAHANFYQQSSFPCVGGPTEVGHYNGTGGTNNARSFYGCYDLTGNVHEWTGSIYSGTNRVVRGGAWTALFSSAPSEYYSFTRNPADRTVRHPNIGFRLVLDPN